MAAYVLSEVEILDEMIADRYRRIAAASIAQHGGRYLVRLERRLIFVDGVITQ